MADSPLLFSVSDLHLHSDTMPPTPLRPDDLAALLRAGPAPDAHPTLRFWAACTQFALHLIARARVVPYVAADGTPGWRTGPLDPDDLDHRARLAGALPDGAVLDPPADAEHVVQIFLDAVADATVASVAGGDGSFGGGPEPGGDVDWTQALAARLDPRCRVSIRIEVAAGSPDPETEAAGVPALAAVVQVQHRDRRGLRDADVLWSDADTLQDRREVMLSLRRVAPVWAAVDRLLSQSVPDRLILDDDDVAELFDGAGTALARAGVAVHWPADLSRGLEAAVMINADARPDFGSGAEGVAYSWDLRIDGSSLNEEEIARIRAATSPIISLRNRWVLIDPPTAKRLRRRTGTMTAMEALAGALSGRAVLDGGESVPVVSAGAFEQIRDRLAHEPEPAVIAPPSGLQAVLRDYQLVGMQWMARMTSLGLGVCLADDMGLGKTISLIALHLHLEEMADQAVRTLIICPASLLGNWEREIGRFAPDVAVRRFHGPARDLDGFDGGFVLTTYATMRLDAERLADQDLGWDLVVLDEAQHVKNPRSSTSRAVRTIPSRSRIALTGTPVENNLTDLWAILDWASPGLLGRLKQFRTRWADPIESGIQPAVATAFARLIGPFVLRRRKSDPEIAPELPPKTETDQPVELTSEQVALYRSVVDQTMAEIASSDGFARRGLIMKLLTACKQICNHPAQYLKEDRPTIAGRSGKIDLLDELLDTIRVEGGAALVFTQYVAMAKLLERHLQRRGIGTLLLHGGTPVAQREQMVADFQQAAEDPPVFLLSLKAAGTGLNLTRADHVIHVDRWWNPAVEDQASDRAYRIGQTQPVQVHRLIAEGTVEDKIAAMLASKRELAASVLQSGEAALTELGNDELAALFEWEGAR